MKKLNTKLVQVTKAVELIIAFILMIGIAVAIVNSIYYGAVSLIHHDFQLEQLLEKVLTLVVGVEFVKMLILHTPESVIEVLLYAVARQIILSHESAMENLIGVMAVVLIFVIRNFFLSKNGQ